MKAKCTHATVVKIVLIIALSSTFFGCRKDISDTGNSPAGNLKVTNDNLNSSPGHPKAYNLNVFLIGLTENSRASGFINFHQDPDTARIIALGTRVSHLEPNHSYILERAVNPITDTTDCSSTAWLKLGRGLVPKAIHTDEHGMGHADLWRNVTAIPRGTSFHIHFQVVDSATMAPVLTSGCYEYTVR